jgi:predicted DNA-binding transcriptional regulator AlpA
MANTERTPMAKGAATAMVAMENRYTNGQAASQIGVTKNTLYRWEVRKAAGDPNYADFPAPRRIKHSNHRFWTDADIRQVVEWKNRLVESAA